MFERYTEKARRIIFFARYEASQLGADAIDIEHLMLAIFREDKILMGKFFTDPSLIYTSIRQETEQRYERKARVSESVDLPLSSGAKRVLQRAAGFSDSFSHNYIGTEHLLLGILDEEQSTVSQILREHGLNVNQMADYLQSGGFSSEEEGSWRGDAIDAITGGTEAGEAPFTTTEIVKKLLLNQFDSIVNKLIRHCHITPQELIDRIEGGQMTEPYLESRFQALLDLLAVKGVITEEEKREINLPED